MKLSEMPLGAALSAFRSTSPTPGGGSAAALVAALGASLLTMVGTMPKHRAASEQDVDRLQAAARRCADLSERLIALADEDSAAYEGVIAAYRMPKATDDEHAARSARVQQALAGAIEVPLEVMRRSGETLEAAVVVAMFGNRNAASDVGVAIELLTAAQRGARLNVEINLGSVKDAGDADRVRREAELLAIDGDSAVRAAKERLTSE